MKPFLYLLLFTLIGLIVGYLIFGQVNNEYVNPEQFLSPKKGITGFATNLLYGLEEKRNSILITGGVGGIIGLFFGLLITKKSKEK